MTVLYMYIIYTHSWNFYLILLLFVVIKILHFDKGWPKKKKFGWAVYLINTWEFSQVFKLLFVLFFEPLVYYNFIIHCKYKYQCFKSFDRKKKKNTSIVTHALDSQMVENYKMFYLSVSTWQTNFSCLFFFSSQCFKLINVTTSPFNY